MGAELNNQATSQQSQSRKITAKRGTIYDATGKYELAVSSSVEAVTINPTNISKENKEKVAKALSDIFELDYEKVLKRLKSGKIDCFFGVPFFQYVFQYVFLCLFNNWCPVSSD